MAFEGSGTAAQTRQEFLRRSGAAVLAASAGGVLIDALGRPAAASAASTKSLTFALFQNPDTLDPAGTSLVSTGQVLLSLFDPLVWYIPGSGGGDHVPGLAKSWKVSKDATRYTFQLRDDVTFHDGTHFDAAAVKATFDHIVNPKTKAKSELGSLGPFKQAVVHGKYTVEIVFAQPNAAFTNEMSTIFISSPVALKRYGASYGQHPVGTGPFVFKQFVPGQFVKVEQNPKYRWGPKSVHRGPALLSDITFRVLSDPSAQYNALQTGELTMAQSLTPTDIVAATSGGRFKRFSADAAGLPYSLVLNTQKPPTSDVRVRRALSYAVDKDAIIKTLYKGLYRPATSLLTAATLGYSPSQNLYRHDPARAAKLLDQAGWTRKGSGTRSKGGEQMNLSIINAAGFGFDDITQLMQSQFASLGVKSTISDQAFPAVNATYSKGVMHLSDWFYADVDPSFLGVLFTCGQIGSKGTGFNDARFCNPAVDKALAAAAGEADPKKRAAMYDKVVHTLMGQAVAIPIYDLRYIYVGPSTLKGIAFTRDGGPLFHGVTY
jgi:peptide/nickel transport system substrate-binding protein